MELLFRQGNFNIPHRSEICGSDYEFPYILFGDEIFPLQEWLMWPYAGSSLINDARKIFNSFLANAPILYPLKIPENQRFSGIFRGYKMVTWV